MIDVPEIVEQCEGKIVLDLCKNIKFQRLIQTELSVTYWIY